MPPILRPFPRTCTSGSRSRIPTNSAPGCSTSTFLLSNWSCIFGHGCQGVLTAAAEQLHQGCCSYGAHFIDDDDLATVEAAAARLTGTSGSSGARPQRGGFHDRGRRAPASPASSTGPASSSTGPASRAASAARCNRPRSRPANGRSTGSPTCAGSSRSGSSSTPTNTATSPRRCASGSAATGARAARSSTGGAPSRPTRSSGAKPVYEYLRDEITEFTGPAVYALLVNQLERRRTTGTPLPHPAVRR